MTELKITNDLGEVTTNRKKVKWTVIDRVVGEKVEGLKEAVLTNLIYRLEEYGATAYIIIEWGDDEEEKTIRIERVK